MKNFLLPLLLVYLTSCKTSDYYHGYVLNNENKPLSNVTVMEDNKMPSSTTTDKTGYFKLLKSPNSVSKLIFLAEGYQIDTTRTVWNRYDGAGKRFLNKIPDTLILRKLLHPKNNP